MGAVLSAPKFRKFWLEIKWTGQSRFGPTRTLGNTSKGCSFWPIRSFRSENVRNVPFHLTKFLSPVPLLCILLTRKMTKRAVGRVCTIEMYRSTGHISGNFRNSKPEFLLNGERPIFTLYRTVIVRTRKTLRYSINSNATELEPRSGGRAGKGRRACDYVSGIWIPLPIPLWLSVDLAFRCRPISAKQKRARMLTNIEKHVQRLLTS